MAQEKRKRFGKLAPKYNFTLNPYPDLRFSKCPICEGKTGQFKLPLLIHIDPKHLISLNYTNRYCSKCDLLIGHKNEIEHHLTSIVEQLNPHDIGNDYLIMCTIEKKSWREGIKQPLSFTDMIENAHDFKNYEILRVTMTGWFRNDETPPLRPPSPSTEWIK